MFSVEGFLFVRSTTLGSIRLTSHVTPTTHHIAHHSTTTTGKIFPAKYSVEGFLFVRSTDLRPMQISNPKRFALVAPFKGERPNKRFALATRRFGFEAFDEETENGRGRILCFC